MVWTRMIVALGLMALMTASVACTSETAGSREVIASRIDPKADAVLKRMCETLSGAKAFTFEAEGYMDERLDTGQLVQLCRRSKVMAVRPDRLHVETVGDDCSRVAQYDGRTVTVLDRSAQTYATIDAPDRIEAMLDHVIEEYGLTIPLADVLFPNLYETLTGNVQSGTYLGIHTVDGHACDHLAFQQETIDWQVWIDAGPTAVPRKLVITYTQEPGQPHYVATLDKWNLAAKPAAGQFMFRPPPGTKAVKMTELLGVAKEE